MFCPENDNKNPLIMNNIAYKARFQCNFNLLVQFSKNP